MTSVHKPVLLAEVLDLLDLHAGDSIIDCTLGGGGHSLAILERISPDGKVLAIDADPGAIQRFKLKIQNSKLKTKERLTLVSANFKDLKKIYAQRFSYPIRAVLLDLGLSSDQFEASGRGFSFQKAEPLDMRYHATKPRKHKKRENTQSLTAEKIVNKWTRQDLERIFRIYGEESRAKQIAADIVRIRKHKPIKTTKDLVNIILEISPRPSTRDLRSRYGASARRASQVSRRTSQKKRLHPATKIFQALRIAVNDELENLRNVLPQALELLEVGGRLAVISFHGLEDKQVKNFFKQAATNHELNIITKRPVKPSQAEIKKNPRARSARLRVAEKK